VYDGEVFDSKGEVLNVGDLGGRWEEFNWTSVLTQFEKDFNCRVNYDSAGPYYPKLAASDIDHPTYDLVTMPAADVLKAQDFFVSQAEYLANVPNAVDLWDSARQGPGLVWLWGKVGYATMRTKTKEPLASPFRLLWDRSFNDRRGGYVSTEQIQQMHLLAASKSFGTGFEDWQAGIRALKDAAPWSVGEFTAVAEEELASGRILIAPLTDAETYWWASTGPKVKWADWGDLTPPLQQIKNVSKGSRKKRLAYALLNRCCSPEVQQKWAEKYYWRPTNKKATVPANLASLGVKNDHDEMAGLWRPDWTWWNGHEKELVDNLTLAVR
jgi:putative spermidine/putrescine transport system substrate-binding protein